MYFLHLNTLSSLSMMVSLHFFSLIFFFLLSSVLLSGEAINRLLRIPLPVPVFLVLTRYLPCAIAEVCSHVQWAIAFEGGDNFILKASFLSSGLSVAGKSYVSGSVGTQE